MRARRNAPHWRASRVANRCIRRSLRSLKANLWGDLVTIVSEDMRRWTAPEAADILVREAPAPREHARPRADWVLLLGQVSELLGSFGDNELSPECLDGAQRFLRRTRQPFSPTAGQLRCLLRRPCAFRTCS